MNNNLTLNIYSLKKDCIEIINSLDGFNLARAYFLLEERFFKSKDLRGHRPTAGTVNQGTRVSG